MKDFPGSIDRFLELLVILFFILLTYLLEAVSNLLNELVKHLNFGSKSNSWNLLLASESTVFFFYEQSKDSVCLAPLIFVDPPIYLRSLYVLDSWPTQIFTANSGELKEIKIHTVAAS